MIKELIILKTYATDARDEILLDVSRLRQRHVHAVTGHSECSLKQTSL